MLFTCYLSSAQSSNGDVSSLPIDSKTNSNVRYYYYPNLEDLSYAYFEKYESNYDWNDYIRLIKFFDNSKKISWASYEVENINNYVNFKYSKNFFYSFFS